MCRGLSRHNMNMHAGCFPGDSSFAAEAGEKCRVVSRRSWQGMCRCNTLCYFHPAHLQPSEIAFIEMKSITRGTGDTHLPSPKPFPPVLSNYN